MHVALLNAHDASRYRSLMLQAYEHAADAFTTTADECSAEPESWWIERIGSPQGKNAAFVAFSTAALPVWLAPSANGASLIHCPLRSSGGFRESSRLGGMLKGSVA